MINIRKLWTRTNLSKRYLYQQMIYIFTLINFGVIKNYSFCFFFLISFKNGNWYFKERWYQGKVSFRKDSWTVTIKLNINLIVRGSFGEVKKAKNKVTGEEFACKIVNKYFSLILVFSKNKSWYATRRSTRFANRGWNSIPSIKSCNIKYLDFD